MSLLIVLPIALLVLLVVGGVVLLVNRSNERGEALDPPISGGVALQESPPETLIDPDADVDELVEAARSSEADLIESAEVDEEFERIVEEELRPTIGGRVGRLRNVFSGYVTSILSRSQISDQDWDDLEEAMLLADVGVKETTSLLDSVRASVKKQGLSTPAELLEAVKAEMKSRIAGSTELRFADDKPTVWLFVGVNGVGKTTTIGKMGRMLVDQGKTVTMAAGDTFRAAAAEQLGTWAQRCGADLVRGAEGGDPSSVIFDAVASAAASGNDIVLADTAGRLHTKGNLMEELAKVRRVADKGAGTVTEVLLVIDAVTGQNGLEQARKFAEATDVTGVVLTKLDGSAKGGVVLPIRSELGIPIKFVGLGESALQLVEFDSDAFVDALFEPVE
ncbi:MAG: signal recognition particle-docking protein FtsY [Microthrixaceae bacterium]|nr:signal recognition particle-docking protein FtsY [Microthrixaceae bacterium]